MRSHDSRPVAIVTGASEGIGLAVARRLSVEGYAIALVARDDTRLCQVASLFDAETATVTADLSDPGSGAAIVSAVLDRYSRIDTVVHCASATRFGAALELTDQEWVDGFTVKVFGALRLIRAAWPALKATGGQVVNIGGIGARTPRAATAMSGPLSAALLAITKVFADQGITDKVRVNAINPGPILTPRLIGMLDQQAEASGTTREALIGAMVETAGASRIGTPEDVAELVAFILSPGGSLLQGALIDLDGGITKGL